MCKKWLVITALMFFVNLTTKAQCAMCKATIESSLENGGGIGGGLNKGILYLMAFPYILLLFFALTWFFYMRKKTTN